MGFRLHAAVCLLATAVLGGPLAAAEDPERGDLRDLRVGMSVVPTIDTGRSFVDVLKELNPFK